MHSSSKNRDAQVIGRLDDAVERDETRNQQLSSRQILLCGENIRAADERGSKWVAALGDGLDAYVAGYSGHLHSKSGGPPVIPRPQGTAQTRRAFYRARNHSRFEDNHMSTLDSMLERNKDLAARQSAAGTLMPSLPRGLPNVKAIVIGCADMRVDPAHVLGVPRPPSVPLRRVATVIESGWLY